MGRGIIMVGKTSAERPTPTPEQITEWNADVERLVAMQIEETKRQLKIMSNPYTGINFSGKENRRARREAERRNKKFPKRFE